MSLDRSVTCKTSKRASFLAAIVLVSTVSVCRGPTPPPTSGSIAVTPSFVTLIAPGEEVQLSAAARDENGDTVVGTLFTWTSSNPAVATVSSSGIVSSVGNGTATIAATANGATGSSKVTVAITSHETQATGADGIARFVQDNVEIEALDIVTGQPVQGVRVTIVEDGTILGLLVFDPTGRFAPIIKLTDHRPSSRLASSSPALGADGAVIRLLVQLVPRSLRDPIAGFTLTINGTLVWYGKRSEWFECRETILDDTFAQIRVALEGVYSSLGDVTLWALGASVASAGVAAPLATFIEGVGILSSVGSFGAIAYNQLLVEYYKALGYAGSDRFEVCHLTAQYLGEFLDGLILLAPIDNRRPRPATASLRGTIRSSTTSAVLQANVQLVGPSPRGISTQSGSFELTGMIPGFYTLVAASPGYVPSSLTVVLSEGQAATQDVILSPGSAADFELIAGTYLGLVDETSDELRLNAGFTFNLVQLAGVLGGDYSISGTIGTESVTGTGTLSGTIPPGRNPPVNLTSTSGVCTNFSNQFQGTYDASQGVITLTGTVHIFRIATCELFRAYPNTVIRFTREGVNRVTESNRSDGAVAGG